MSNAVPPVRTAEIVSYPEGRVGWSMPIIAGPYLNELISTQSRARVTNDAERLSLMPALFVGRNVDPTRIAAFLERLAMECSRIIVDRRIQKTGPAWQVTTPPMQQHPPAGSPTSASIQRTDVARAKLMHVRTAALPVQPT